MKKIIQALMPQYFIVVEEQLSDEAHKRIKKQISEQWPELKKRPILLEGGAKPVKL